MSSWHVSETALRRWIDRSDSLAEGTSVEQHLLSCGRCRELVAAAVTSETAFDLVDLAGVWSRTRDAIQLDRKSVV